MLAELPVHMDNLAPECSEALRNAETLVAALPTTPEALVAAKQAADMARDVCIEYLDAPDAVIYSAAYAAASLLWAAALLVEAAAAASKSSASTAATAAMRAIDLAIMRGGVDDWAAPSRPLIYAADAFLVSATSTAVSDATNGPKAEGTTAVHEAARQHWERTCSHFVTGASRPSTRAIPRVDARTLTADDFRARYMEPSEGDGDPRPLILTHVMEGWPAFSGDGGDGGDGTGAWSMRSFRERHGHRLVPVETYSAAHATSTYLSSSWAQRVMPLREFLDRYVLAAADGAGSHSIDHNSNGDEDGGSDDEARGYLAQHPLLEQIPQLRDQIRTPALCSAWGREDAEAPAICEIRRDPIVSAWVGPAGTVSPVHTDPYHNLLCQGLGHKYVRLYAAKETKNLYPRSGALCNNSHANLDHLDRDAHPLVESAPFWQCILAPGETLYIPRHFWHYVRSLEPSISVSFWWGARMALSLNSDGSVEARY